MKTNPFLLTDYYKVGHVFQYPDKTELVYSNLTPRNSRLKDIDEMVFFGMQYFIKEYLIKYFNENFFDQAKEKVISDYKRRISTSLGAGLPTYQHLERLHELGFLPIKIKIFGDFGTILFSNSPLPSHMQMQIFFVRNHFDLVIRYFFSAHRIFPDK